MTLSLQSGGFASDTAVPTEAGLPGARGVWALHPLSQAVPVCTASDSDHVLTLLGFQDQHMGNPSSQSIWLCTECHLTSMPAALPGWVLGRARGNSDCSLWVLRPRPPEGKGVHHPLFPFLADLFTACLPDPRQEPGHHSGSPRPRCDP